MSNVTKHDPKQEDDSKEAWVDLLVHSDTVQVHDCLEALCELIHLMEHWQCLDHVQLMQDRWHRGA